MFQSVTIISKWATKVKKRPANLWTHACNKLKWLSRPTFRRGVLVCKRRCEKVKKTTTEKNDKCHMKPLQRSLAPRLVAKTTAMYVRIFFHCIYRLNQYYIRLDYFTGHLLRRGFSAAYKLVVVLFLTRKQYNLKLGNNVFKCLYIMCTHVQFTSKLSITPMVGT